MSNVAAPETPVEPAASKKINTRAAGIVGLAVMCSRVLGLAREMIFNALFPAATLSLFFTAFRVPNLLRDLFAEGALSTAFVTTFSKKIATDGDKSAWGLAHKIGTLTLVFMSVLTLLGMIFSEQLISVLAGGFTGDAAVRTARLTAVMFPFILLVSLAAQIMGMLNAKHVFGWPAMASSFFNIGSIVGGVALAWWIDPKFGPDALMGLAVGTLIGGFLQLAVQIPSLWKIGYRPRLDFGWRDEGVKTVLRLMAPAVVAASAVQVNVMVNTSFATHCEMGSVTWLNNAFRLMQLPLGLFGVAIGTVTLPLLAKTVALGDHLSFRQSLARGMRLAFVLTIPSAVGLIVLARPIIGLLYERGASTPYDTNQAAAALQFYAIGLVAYSGIKVLAPAFYAIDKRKTPMVVSFVAIGVNLVLNWFFTFHLGFGHRGLALSTGCVALTNFIALYFLMRRETRLLETTQMLWTFAKLAVPTLLLGAICWGAQATFLQDWYHYGFAMRAVALLGTIGVAGATFFLTALFFRIEELDDFSAFVTRRFGRFLPKKTV
jgi:putative peptidoglycan lipid II flippase